MQVCRCACAASDLHTTDCNSKAVVSMLLPQAQEILQYFGNEKWAYIQDMLLLDYEREECASMPLLPQSSILPSSCWPDWRCAR